MKKVGGKEERGEGPGERGEKKRGETIKTCEQPPT